MKAIIAFFTALLLTFSVKPAAKAEEPAQEDYMSIVRRAALCGDVEVGRAAMSCYNDQLDANRSEEPRLNFDELFLLSKLIYFVSGSEQLSDEWRMCTGEVVLNRMISPEFPNTMEEVIFQEGQYDGVDTDYFAYVLTPTEECVEAALRLLRGERLMESHVVFQASSPQGGELYRSFYDYELGNTFFCTSPNLQYYPSAAEAKE